MELVTMQDMDTDLLNFDAFFSTNNDDEVQELWALTTSPTTAQDDDDAHGLLDTDDIEPLSPQFKREQEQDMEQNSTQHCQQEQKQEQEPHDRQQNAETEQHLQQVKSEAGGKPVLQLDTVMTDDHHKEFVHSSGDDWMTQLDDKAVVTPTAMLPARFQLLSTTCVYEPGFTSSPRGKRRISETTAEYDDEDEEAESDCGCEHGDCEHGEAKEGTGQDRAEGPASDASQTFVDSGFFLSSDDDYNLPVFTDAELSAMVDSPSKVSTSSTASACSATSCTIDDAMPQSASSSTMSVPTPLASLQTLCCSSSTEKEGQSTRSNSHDTPDVVGIYNTVYSESTGFAGSAQQNNDFQDVGNSDSSPALSIFMPSSQQLFSTAPPFLFTASTSCGTSSSAMPATSTSAGNYFSPSSYAEAANQFLGSQQHPVQPFFLNPDALSPVTKATFFPDQRQPIQTQGATQTQTNAQVAAAVAMANSAAAMNTIRKLNATYGVPIAPLQRRAGSLPPNMTLKGAPSIKPRLVASRSASMTAVMPLQARVAPISGGKVTRLAITPDIADFKLVQIFHQFCDPNTKLLTLPRFQQLVLHHQVKEDSPNGSGSGSSTSTSTSNGSSSASAANANVVMAPDAQTLFKLLDVEEAGFLDLERFMQSFQICNRCTEAKRRAHQALCASQGQAFSPSALERQLMEDVAPVLVRVVPTRFEGSKVKSCEHYQWTWCEGFDKTGNEKCRGTNRHDKCPKYLANCTLWKHKLPPKSRKPKVLLENLDSPSKKFKHFS